MIHRSLPQTKTAEALAIWITDQKKDTITHTDEYPLTKEEIQQFEHDSSVASRALDRLKDIEDGFKAVIKEGTPVKANEETGESEYQPVDFTIPPTKGTKALTKNREYADQQIQIGYRYEYTNIYLIPWPEEGKMVAVDIEGKEWPEYTRAMNNFELNANKPLLKTDSFAIKDVLETGDGKVLMMMAKKVKTTDPDQVTKDKGFKGPGTELESDLGPADELPFI